MMNADERSVFRRMEKWVARIDELLAMFGSRGVMPRKDLDLGRDRYASLKDDLKREHRDLSNSRRHAPLTPAEEHWYSRAVHSAMAHRSAPINSAPEQWLDYLHTAHSDFTIALSRMSAAGGKTDDASSK